MILSLFIQLFSPLVYNRLGSQNEKIKIVFYNSGAHRFSLLFFDGFYKSLHDDVFKKIHL